MPFNKAISGYKNEYEFVDYFNGKKINELDPISLDLFEKIYGKKSNNSLIKCYINLNKQKSDIILSINGTKKYISIKKGVKNSVHTEPISKFIDFLKDCGMNYELIKKVLLYQYGDGTMNGTGKKRLSSKEYYINHKKDIQEINDFFNNEEFMKKAIDRFVLYGNNSDIPIDAIIYGVVNDFVWITREEIINIHLHHKFISKTGISIGGLFYQPMNRCLNYNSKYEKARHCIQLKWYHLSDDIIETMALYRC